MIPALVAEGFVPPDAALVQPSLPLALLCKLLLLQTVTVLRTDSGVQRGVEDMTGLVAHRSDLFVQETFGVGQVIPAWRLWKSVRTYFWHL